MAAHALALARRNARLSTPCTMSAVLPAARPSVTPPVAPPSGGFFAHHGIWAPGVRLFRSLRFSAKAVTISLAFMLPMLGLLGWLLHTQAEQALDARMDSARQQVHTAHALLHWAQAQEAGGSLSRAQAQQQARQALDALRRDGAAPVWLIDLASRQRLGDAPGAEAAADAPSRMLLDDAASVAQREGQGFVVAAGSVPQAAATGAPLAYVRAFDAWAWAVGAAVPGGDAPAVPWRQLAWTGGILLLAQLVAGYLFLSFYRVMDGGLRETRRHLRAMAAGDLTTRPRAWGQDESAQLMLELCRMQESLRSMVTRVRDAGDDIAHGAADLSARTDHAAAALEQSAASMAQISAAVKSGAEHTEEASCMARHNADIAAGGGQVMHEVVDTMDGIRAASARIAEIVGTIDGIAFQTNILALNAAVEAARAGAQGRGFAVVANEVRMLAQRSAEAAKEIKALIGGSVSQVEAGTHVVRKAGAAMQDIVAASQRVNELLGEVATGARAQSLGIGQVGQAVVELDRVTQQNAALVGQTAQSAAAMRELAQVLAEEVAGFKLPAP
jgi:methyl-accepting chemotaxis protein